MIEFNAVDQIYSSIQSGFLFARVDKNAFI